MPLCVDAEGDNCVDAAKTVSQGRAGNYDWLRMISTAAVIMIHVSGTFFPNALKNLTEGSAVIEYPFWVCLYNTISRFSVPCFVMLSGAFILDDEKNANYRRFYTRSFLKLGVPTILFSVLYFLYQLTFCFVGNYVSLRNAVNLVWTSLAGLPMYHMWYMYMLTGVYALAPIVFLFKNSVSENTFYKAAFVFLALASASNWTTGSTLLAWDIGQSFEYLAYFMAGYSIKKLGGQKHNVQAAALIVSGLLVELWIAYLRYPETMTGLVVSDFRHDYVTAMSPYMILASVLIFWGFTKLDVKGPPAWTWSLSFYIYLIHNGIWDFTQKVLFYWNGMDFFERLNSALWIPLSVAVIFIVSAILSKAYLWIWGRLGIEKRIASFLGGFLMK